MFGNSSGHLQKDNSSLDDRFAPFGEVEALAGGAEYLDVESPELDRIERVTVL